MSDLKDNVKFLADQIKQRILHGQYEIKEVEECTTTISLDGIVIQLWTANNPYNFRWRDDIFGNDIFKGYSDFNTKQDRLAAFKIYIEKAKPSNEEKQNEIKATIAKLNAELEAIQSQLIKPKQ